MTRDNLIQAISDSNELWSCNFDCNVTKKNDFEFECKRCADKLLEEYENGIRAKVLDEVAENVIPTLYENDIDEEVINKCKELFEQMKECTDV